MKNAKMNRRSKTSGQGLVVLIILVVLVGGGLWYLYSNKWTMDRQARDFGREVVQRLAVNHDAAFLAERLGPAARTENPPSQQQYLMSKFQQFGAPQQPVKIDETVTFESQFFMPQGYFVAHLNYPGQGATLEFGVSHPVGRWQIDAFRLIWDKPR
jgi:hypothetical protein